MVNLSVDTRTGFAETFRALIPGGRIGVSDVVAEDALTPGERAERGSYVGCIAGCTPPSSARRSRGHPGPSTTSPSEWTFRSGSLLTKVLITRIVEA